MGRADRRCSVVDISARRLSCACVGISRYPLSYRHLEEIIAEDAKSCMAHKKASKSPFDLKNFVTKAHGGKPCAEYRINDSIFVQGDTANAVFCINEGKVKLTVISQQGKEAVVALLKEGDFFGEGCLAGQHLRVSSAVALSECSVMKLDRAVVVKLLHDEPTFSELFLAHVLARNIKIEQDLVDQLFNSSEKRLARVLLLLANFGRRAHPKRSFPRLAKRC